MRARTRSRRRGAECGAPVKSSSPNSPLDNGHEPPPPFALIVPAAPCVASSGKPPTASPELLQRFGWRLTSGRLRAHAPGTLRVTLEPADRPAAGLLLTESSEDRRTTALTRRTGTPPQSPATRTNRSAAGPRVRAARPCARPRARRSPVRNFPQPNQGRCGRYKQNEGQQWAVELGGQRCCGNERRCLDDRDIHVRPLRSRRRGVRNRATVHASGSRASARALGAPAVKRS